MFKKKAKWTRKAKQLLEMMRRLGRNLMRPMAGLPALKELDVRIKTHPNLPVTPILPIVLDQLKADLGTALREGQFAGLNSLRLTAGASDLVPIMHELLESKTCSTLQSLHCKQLTEDVLSYRTTRLPGTPGGKPVLIDGVLKAQCCSQSLTAAIVSKCPDLKNLSIPTAVLLDKNLKLHEKNNGLESLVLMGSTRRATEGITSMKRLTLKRKPVLKIYWGGDAWNMYATGKFRASPSTHNLDPLSGQHTIKLSMRLVS